MNSKDANKQMYLDEELLDDLATRIFAVEEMLPHGHLVRDFLFKARHQIHLAMMHNDDIKEECPL